MCIQSNQDRLHFSLYSTELTELGYKISYKIAGLDSPLSTVCFGYLVTPSGPCEESVQTVQMCGLILVFTGHTNNLVRNAVPAHN